MKKLKMFFCVAVLSTLLGTNVLAGDFVTVGATSFLGNFIASLFGTDQNCPVRQCGDCHPIVTGSEEGDVCRPPAE
jgi:hypothetical protein